MISGWPFVLAVLSGLVALRVLYVEIRIRLSRKRARQQARKAMTPERAAWIASKEWLSTPEHKRWAHDVKEASDGHCQLCGRGKHDQNEDGSRVVLNSDHIKPRKTHPWLALDPANGQCLCDFCNHGRGNRSSRDWRKR